MVQPQRTSSNLLEPLQCRGSKVSRGLSHEFGVVRLYRTCIFTGGTRCVGYLCTSSGWFNRSKPPRTFLSHFNAEKARCVEVFRMCSGWFDYTEPFLTASSHGEQGVWVPIHYFRVVQPQRTSSNLLEPLQCRESKVCRGLSHEFGMV